MNRNCRIRPQHEAMNFLVKTLLCLLTAFFLTRQLALAGGEEVVVVYNANLPDSKMVAEHYAAARSVPAKQVFSFALPTNEVMSRVEFMDSLQKPLARKLESSGLWKFGPISIPATTNQPAHQEERVVASKIRYAVLCYGVPLKIAESSIIETISEKITREELRSNAAAVDSELAWLPLIKLNPALTGPMPNRLYASTNNARLTPQNGILLVARLDGPTPKIAAGLVDKALEAEQNGLWGRAYIDARGFKTNDNYYLGDEWMMNSAEICRHFGFETELDTNASTLPAEYPMSHIGIYAGWYHGDVCGPFTQPKVEFMPGAFAYHLYSFSAQSLRTSSSFWCGPLLAKGATCTMGCVYEPYLQFTPNVAFFLEAFLNGFSFGEAAWASQNSLSWQNTVIGDPLYRPYANSPGVVHAHLKQTNNPIIEWSFDRLVCVNVARGAPLAQMTSYLQNIPESAQSAVLTEKLASLYASLGKPNSAIDTWQQALKLNPTPGQRIRIRKLISAEMLAQGREADAADNWRKLLAEAPDYPGKPAIEKSLEAIALKLHPPTNK